MDEQVTCPICKQSYPAETASCPTCFIEMKPLKQSWESDVDAEEQADETGIPAANGQLSPEPDAAPGEVRCPSCGDVGQPGNACRQCGQMLPEQCGQGEDAEIGAAESPAPGGCTDDPCSPLQEPELEQLQRQQPEQSRAQPWAQADGPQPADPQPAAVRTSVKVLMPNGYPIELSCGAEMLIGRESASSRIRDALSQFSNVSRRHCMLSASNDGALVTVRDLGSTNGTWIEGRTDKIPPETPVAVPVPTRIRLGERLFVSIE